MSSRLTGLRGVVVLGMGRSGTSAVTRMFHGSGFFVGSQADLMEGDQSNPTGYFENWRVYHANELVLDRLDGSWFDTPPDAQQLSLNLECTPPLREILEELLCEAGEKPLAVKDPRIGMLMALWWPLLKGLLHPVMVVRHPLEVALSLERRDGTALPVGLAMWELHMTRLLNHLHGQRVTVLPYRRMVEEPRLADQLLAETSTELPAALRRAVQTRGVGDALRPELRRSRLDALNHVPWLSADQKRLWELLDSLPPGIAVLRARPSAREAGEQARALAGYEKRRQRAVFELRVRIERAGCDLAERDRRLEEQKRELAEQGGALAEQFDQLEASARRIVALEAELDSAREECDAAKQRLRTAEHWLAVTTSSRSWRLTEPLRAARRLLRSASRTT
jgi:hypothetical protein